MRGLTVLGLLATVACATSTASRTSAAGSGAASAAAVPAPTPSGGTGAAAPAPRPDSVTLLRDSLRTDVLKRIAGREQQPAESVFKHIVLFKGRTAQQVMGTMGTWGRSLGVSCGHCHTVGQYENEDKAQKQIARDMVAMVANINTQLLANIKNLQTPRINVGCTTCHRGQPRPSNLLVTPGATPPPGQRPPGA
jgi:hypothetical protein